MNVLKKLFGKKKIEEIETFKEDPNIINFIPLSICGYEEENIISVLIVFGENNREDYFKVMNILESKVLITYKDGLYYSYINSTYNKYLSLINRINPNNKFFKYLLEPLYLIDKNIVEYLYEDKLLDIGKYDGSIVNDKINIDDILERDLSRIRSIFSMEEIASGFTIPLYNDNIYNTLIFHNNERLIIKLESLLGDFTKILDIIRYKDNVNNIDELISEDYGELIEQVIEEDEDGNLIYDKNNFK